MIMNKLRLTGLISLVILTTSFSGTSQTLTAKEIVIKSQDKVNGESNRGAMKMTVVRPNWSREVEMKVWSLGEDFYMIYILSPARDKGQVFMKRETDMWNWMPSISRMIKIPPSMMSQSWMGSDFTNNDLMRMNSYINDYTHRILGEEEINGYQCYKVELMPLPDAAVVWGKIHIWISKDEFYQMQFEFFDEEMEAVNREICSDVKQFGDRKLPSKMVMTPMDKPGNQTIIEISEMEYNVNMQESFFSQQNMKNLR